MMLQMALEWPWTAIHSAWILGCLYGAGCMYCAMKWWYDMEMDDEAQ